MANDELTPEETRAWLRQEIDILNRAHELRIKDATSIVEAYEQGKMSLEDFAQLHGEYMDRWGETLHMIDTTRHTTDAEILAELKRQRNPESKSVGAGGRFGSRSGGERSR